MQDLLLFASLLFVANLGIVAHWKKKHFRGQTLATFVRYVTTHKKHSWRTGITVFVSIVTMFTYGDVEFSKQWIANAFLAGFGFDSVLNKAPEED